MRFIIAPIALFFSASLASSAAEKIDFRTLALADAKFPELWVAASGKAVQLSFSSSQPSLALKADRINPFKIFKGPLDGKGKPMDTSPTLVKLPKSQSILLLGWMEEEKPAFLAVADPIATAKGDDWLIINHTPKPLTIQIGESATALPIEANTQQMVKCTAPVGEGASTAIASQKADGSWKTIYTSYLPIHADKRGLILVVQEGENIIVNYIADEIARKPASKH